MTATVANAELGQFSGSGTADTGWPRELTRTFARDWLPGNSRLVATSARAGAQERKNITLRGQKITSPGQITNYYRRSQMNASRRNTGTGSTASATPTKWLER